MNVDFAPDQQPLVQQAIESGRINRPEDAAREAFSLWAEHERHLAEHRAINHTKAQEAVARILELRKGNILPEGVTIRDLIHEGALDGFRPRQLRYHALVLSECGSPLCRQRFWPSGIP